MYSNASQKWAFDIRLLVRVLLGEVLFLFVWLFGWSPGSLKKEAFDCIYSHGTHKNITYWWHYNAKKEVEDKVEEKEG
jgi:hypothetical protein